MSHVDEGTLHAYLDGALGTFPAAEADRVRRHLAECGVCQARLEEERIVRDEASTVLGGAVLDPVDTPSFEEVRALAGRRASPPGVGMRRLAWAASVMLALGTGWLLRGGLPQSEVLSSPTGRGSVVAEPRTDDVVPAVGRETEAAPEEATAKAAAADREDAPDRRGVGAAEVATPATTTDAPVPATSGPPLDVAAAEVSVRAVDAARPEESRVATGENRDRAAIQTFQPTAPGPGDIAVRRALAPATGEAFKVADPRGAPGWAGGSLVVPGLPVVSVSWLEEAGLAGGVRVLQVMEGGDTLELVHLPAGVDPAGLPALEDGKSQLVSPRDGGWLVVRGRVPVDVLSVLVRRLEGGD